jgi:hypothetical protein
MSVTNLACWTLGPQYHHSVSDEQLKCLNCSSPVTDDQFCEGCGQGLCSSCRVLVDHEPHCRWCAADARKGRC